MGLVTPSLRLDNTIRVRFGASIKGLHQVHAYVKAGTSAEKLATLLGMMDRLPMTRSEVFFRDVGSARWVATQLGQASDMSVSVLSHDATEGRQQEFVHGFGITSCAPCTLLTFRSLLPPPPSAPPSARA